jgi:N-acetylmuramoyl-L-alanine amidase
MKPSRVIMHCSDTPDYFIADTHFDLFGAKEIDIWHKQRKFSKIGYHWVIRRTGIIESGRDESEVGAHCKNENIDSIGICYVGTKDPTKMQIESIRHLFLEIKTRHAIDFDSWFTHNYFNHGKICPGFDMAYLQSILNYERMV